MSFRHRSVGLLDKKYFFIINAVQSCLYCAAMMMNYKGLLLFCFSFSKESNWKDGKD